MLKKIVFIILFVVIIFGVLELFSQLSLLELQRKGLRYEPISRYSLNEAQRSKIRDILLNRTRYIDFDPDLGWRLKKNVTYGNYTTNHAGFRDSRDYPLEPAEDVIRIATFGDSFVHCDDVMNAHIWQTKLQENLSQLEVLNFGVGGYGIDQAYLRYLKEGRQYHPHIVVIGFVADDMNRAVNSFRPYYVPGTLLPLSKPRFKIINGNLELIKNPLSSLERYQELYDNEKKVMERLWAYEPQSKIIYHSMPFDFSSTVRLLTILFYQYRTMFLSEYRVVKNNYLNPESLAYGVTLETIDKFYKDTLRNGSLPVIVIFPTVYDIQRKQYYEYSIYHYMKDELIRRHYRFIDLLDYFPTQLTYAQVSSYLGPTQHYSEKGNALAAEHIYSYLKEHHFLDKKYIYSIIVQERQLLGTNSTRF